MLAGVLVGEENKEGVGFSVIWGEACVGLAGAM